ncbi:hypothetical protein PXD04_07590 [Methanosphaera sp. ISO3-F5]|uniref:EamA family transporter n=1 Tax=Methanosphaera sp. ISO3-F5 TaxID=1452353 RepID=UPI002B264519|nr:hypothetical protein [Methanosphaera sp. ISO3-F5]WQH63558.1 hypothetical protein PXD04_07590 [Methanosphaera sp. ISO3-F5]
MILLNMAIPILIIVLSNCLYHICSKTIPGNVNTFGSLTVTYVSAAILSAILFVSMVKPENLVVQLSNINWSSILLGICIVGLEAGYIYAYRLGWQVNNAPVVANTCLAIALLIIGAVLFHEGISVKQIVGMILCIIGLIFINL